MEETRYLTSDRFGVSARGAVLSGALATQETVPTAHVLGTDIHGLSVASAWPVRVFVVAGGTTEGLETTGFRVLEELPGHLILGPNGRAVAHVLHHADRSARTETSDSTRLRCRRLARELEERGLESAVQVIRTSCLGWNGWALQALTAALEEPSEKDDADGLRASVLAGAV
ncbi:hypothetical protein Bequi_09935 [Brachybacterium sp. JHP9]|uniref:Uncharacterized protein n=1 Tax=Brachybacterium equifaecis TaxID=2910770 RepID=A0ABT0R192_9MICO|nr:hypothetical protein [Brachybacterium equifaecis]MCL6423703.1 hypothetical protein [Brachybacterium equifaecis]